MTERLKVLEQSNAALRERMINKNDHLMSMNKNSEANKDVSAEVEAIFNEIDINYSGDISAVEFASYLKKLGK